jgi:hypothetical protein
MVSVIIMTLYVGFLTVAGGGEAIEATIPDEFKETDAPFGEGGLFGILSDLAGLLIGLLKLAWNMVVLMVSVITFDLEAFGLPAATGILRLILATAVTIMTVHILWETTLMVRGST